MKKVIFIMVALLAVAMIACKDKGKKGLRTDAMISLRPEVGVKAANPEHLTALQIVEQADALSAIPVGRRGFNVDQRDLVNVKLLMFSNDIVTDEGVLVTDWIESRDLVIVRYLGGRDDRKDTIAYVSNRVVAKAEIDIKTAYANEDYEMCYTLFDQAFRFIPITGKEWREQKALEN